MAIAITHRMGEAAPAPPPPAVASSYETTVGEWTARVVYGGALLTNPMYLLHREKSSGGAYWVASIANLRGMLGLFAEDVRLVLLQFIDECEAREQARLAEARAVVVVDPSELPTL